MYMGNPGLKSAPEQRFKPETNIICINRFAGRKEKNELRKTQY